MHKGQFCIYFYLSFKTKENPRLKMFVSLQVSDLQLEYTLLGHSVYVASLWKIA